MPIPLLAAAGIAAIPSVVKGVQVSLKAQEAINLRERMYDLPTIFHKSFRRI